ncbi:MAG: 6-phosphogluconolactonase [Ignavibacteriaceae bacterium]|jgi:6-phosphogluconolactonase
MKPVLKIFKSQLDVAEKLASRICSVIEKNNSKSGKTFIAVSGGNTPKILFNVLAEEYREKISWNNTIFFWVDERCVPPEDRDSNYGMTKKFLFDKIDIPEDNIHRVRGENIPEKETVRYTAEIDGLLKFRNKYPNFDLMIMGIGTDGHTASIFPDELQLLKSEKVCAVAVHPQSGQKRVTLTGKVINNSDNVFFLIIGEDKAKVVADIIKQKKNFKKYPTANIEPVNGTYEWYLDTSASKLI